MDAKLNLEKLVETSESTGKSNYDDNKTAVDNCLTTQCVPKVTELFGYRIRYTLYYL